MLLAVIIFLSQRSWVRYRDSHILTIGDYIYTSEYRIQIKADYQLHIKWLQTNDSGIYLCEINTNPFHIIYYYLNVKSNFIFNSLF